jgi:hypothetical protein
VFLSVSGKKFPVMDGSVSDDDSYSDVAPNTNRIYADAVVNNKSSETKSSIKIATASTKKQWQERKSTLSGIKKRNHKEVCCYFCKTLGHGIAACPTAPLCNLCGIRGHSPKNCRSNGVEKDRQKHQKKIQLRDKYKDLEGMSSEEVLSEIESKIKIEPEKENEEILIEAQPDLKTAFFYKTTNRSVVNFSFNNFFNYLLWKCGFWTSLFYVLCVLGFAFWFFQTGGVWAFKGEYYSVYPQSWLIPYSALDSDPRCRPPFCREYTLDEFYHGIPDPLNPKLRDFIKVEYHNPETGQVSILDMADFYGDQRPHIIAPPFYCPPPDVEWHMQCDDAMEDARKVPLFWHGNYACHSLFFVFFYCLMCFLLCLWAKILVPAWGVFRPCICHIFYQNPEKFDIDWNDFLISMEPDPDNYLLVSIVLRVSPHDRGVLERRTENERLRKLVFNDTRLMNAQILFSLYKPGSNPDTGKLITDNKLNKFLYEELEITNVPFFFSGEQFLQMMNPSAFDMTANGVEFRERINNQVRNAGAVTNDRDLALSYTHLNRDAGLAAQWCYTDQLWRRQGLDILK